jgi:hypothetical protein
VNGFGIVISLEVGFQGPAVVKVVYPSRWLRPRQNSPERRKRIFILTAGTEAGNPALLNDFAVIADFL